MQALKVNKQSSHDDVVANCIISLDDGNQYRIHQANTLITSYTSQIEALNTQIAQFSHTLATPITSQLVQQNEELARELGFIDKRQAQQEQQQDQQQDQQTPPQRTEGDLDTNPWTRDSANSAWSGTNILESTSFNAVDLIGHGMESGPSNTTEEQPKGPKQYVWESDADVKECRGCRKRFGLLVRRHHCRCCGLIYCDKCSMSRAYLGPTQILQDPNGPLESLEVLSSHHQRVCDTCYAKLTGIPPP